MKGSFTLLKCFCWNCTFSWFQILMSVLQRCLLVQGMPCVPIPWAVSLVLVRRDMQGIHQVTQLLIVQVGYIVHPLPYLLHPLPCAGNAMCSNTMGGFICACKEGYAGNTPSDPATNCKGRLYCLPPPVSPSPHPLCRQCHVFQYHGWLYLCL